MAWIRIACDLVEILSSWFPFQEFALPLRFGWIPHLCLCSYRLLNVVHFASRPRLSVPRRHCCDSPGVFIFRSPGFSPPRCYQRISGPRSSVLLVHLPPFPAASPWGLLCELVWILLVGNWQLIQGVGLPQVRSHCLTVCRPASPQIGKSQISGLAHSRLLVPPPQGHIAGTLFATYTVSTSCFLQTPGCPRMLLPCWRSSSV